MLGVYLAALLTGGGIIVAQLAGGHDASHDGDALPGHHDVSGALSWTILVSLRFWSFALLAFGLTGAVLHAFGSVGAGVALAFAIADGVASGLAAVVIVRRLLTRSPQSMASHAEVVGRIGRVVVPLAPPAAGKVRVEVRGTWVDVVARAREPIEAGESVLVEEWAFGEARVSRAPKELAP